MLGSYDGSDTLSYRLIFENSELIFSSTSAASGLRFVFDTALNYNELTYEGWRSLLFDGERKQLWPMYEIQLGSTKIDALTYSYRFTRNPVLAGKTAVLQFFINGSTLVPRDFDDRCTCMLLSGSNVLWSCGADAGQTDAQLLRLDESLDDNWYKTKTGIVVYSTVADYKLAMFVPKEIVTADLAGVKKPLLWMLAGFAVIEAVLSMYLAKRNASPITRLAGSAGKLANASVNKNEFEILDESLVKIENDLKAAQQGREIGTALLLSSLFIGQQRDLDTTYAAAQDLGISLNATAYCVAIIETAPDIPSFDCVFNLSRNTGILFCELEKLRYGVLFTGFNPNELQSTALSLLKQVLETGCCLRFGLGSVYESIEDITFSYHQAEYCLQSGVSEKNDVVYESISGFLSTPKFTPEQQQRLLNALKLNNSDVIDREFDLIINENTVKRHLPSIVKRTLLDSIAALLLTAAGDIIEGESISDFLRSLKLNEYDFIGGIIRLREAFKQTAAELNRQYNGACATALKKTELLTYLETAYTNPELSLSSTAEHFGLSDSYFSVLFKEQMGQNYSTYIEALRLKRALVILKNTDMSIESVAACVGYSNTATFRRAFKRVYGISPQQQRESP